MAYSRLALIALALASCAAPRNPTAAAAVDAPTVPEHAMTDEVSAAWDVTRRTDAAPTSARSLDTIAVLTAGADALANGNAILAVDLIDGYLALDPECAMAHFLMGVALLDLGHLAAARESLRQATRLDPDDVGSLSVLARVHYDLGELPEAVAALERATTLEPEAAQHWTSLGLLRLEQASWTAAYDAFMHAIELDSSEVEAHRGLGRIYASVGEFELAESAYRTALSFKRDDPSLNVALGHVLRDAGRSDEALEHYRTASRFDPGNPWIEANLASTYLELRRHSEARPHFESALSELDQVGDDYALVQLNYGIALEALGDIDGALQAFELAVNAGPELGRAHEALGLVHLDLDDEAAARRHLDRAFELIALQPSSLVQLVLLHEKVSDWEEAARCAAPLLASDPTTATLGFRRAQLHVMSSHPEIHDPAAAVDILKPLVQDGLRDHPASWVLMAEALAELGELESAVSAVDRALGVGSFEGPARERWTARRDGWVSRLAEP